MTRRKTLTALTTLAVVFGYGGAAQADPYADGWVNFNPVTSGTNFSGTALSTWSDGDTDGIDAVGAPDWTGNLSQATVLGFDANGTDGPVGGTLVLGFLNNVCVDGPGNDIKVYDAYGVQSTNGNESGKIEVSNDGGQTFVHIGDVNPTTGFELDLAGALPDFDQVRLTATDAAGLNTAAGLDVDAVECLNSVDGGSASGGGTPPPPVTTAVTATDGCDLFNGTSAGLDVREIVADSDGMTVYVDIALCGDVASRSSYTIGLDYADQTNLDGDNVDDGPDSFDGNDSCSATEDDLAVYQDGASSGPGWFVATGDTISYEVNYTDLLAGSGAQAGNNLVLWVETRSKGKGDLAPNAEDGDRCDRPQVDSEAIVLELQPIP